MTITDPIAYHARQKDQFSAEKAALAKLKNQIAWGRLLTIIAGAWLLVKTWPASIGIGFLVAAITIAIFLWLYSKSLTLSRQIILLEQKTGIHDEEISIASHQFTQRYSGKNLEPKTHDYAGDLDIFGQASLFQYIQRTTSEQGHQALAKWLLAPAPNDLLTQRQAATRELAAMPEWSVLLQATGQLHPVSTATENRLRDWLAQPVAFQQKSWRILAVVFPVIALATLAMHIIGFITAGTFYSILPFFMLIAFGISRKVIPQYRALDKVVPQLSTLSDSLLCIENASFKSAFLKDVQATLSPSQKNAASISILVLKKILDRFDIRLNPLVFVPLNTFLLWDLQQTLALEKWKTRQQDKISLWFKVMAEMECLNTLGRLYFNHPSWVFPTLSNSHGQFEAKELGHPLIPSSKRVCNNFSTKGKPAIALITGSNMAGKSTFLRSIGINQVLAMAGSAVCAEELTVANMRIMSSMRIADNLEENTSTFYAELGKLKSIIESVNLHQPVFLLLDEILRGTNSQDRQAGSKALISQLLKKEACGLLATHDLALTELSKDNPQSIHNFHFDVSVSGEELYFDYRLKPGICRSMNASILMKKIGIDL
ncbi:MutS-related protein [Flavihumibacter profundi]|uniref:MutS-related protein n=1 Tax=Flavihumibacter profundi TaxID=2716883 RepID=UPI001CC5A8FB|nr:hypothetical protein [Flavihumibacter profundi]MBZ5856879.1 hypothetical protein [Flavihumibacter profundi]